MKRITLILLGACFVAFAAQAQTTPVQTKKDKLGVNTPVTTVNNSTVQQLPTDVHPSYEKRLHAEQRSNGHAFSGKGKGGEKNIIDPGEKLTTVTDKSDKVPVTTTDTQKKKDKMINKKSN